MELGFRSGGRIVLTDDFYHEVCGVREKWSPGVNWMTSKLVICLFSLVCTYGVNTYCVRSINRRIKVGETYELRLLILQSKYKI